MEENFSLKSYNTFGLDAKAKFFESLHSVNQLNELSSLPSFHTNRLILGGGSNILLTKDFDGLVLHNDLKGIEVLKEDGNDVYLKVASGEVWHDLVLHTIAENIAGLENLSLIPGRVGASPMQNIGAYGIELKDVFESLEAWNIKKQQVETFDRESCQFGYRESVFKNIYKDQYIILSVTLKLSRKANLNISYGAIEDTLKEMGVSSPTIKDVSDAVIAIRSSKLPNPAEIGNAGSFFKNPIVDNEFAKKMLSKHPNMPSYKVGDDQTKIPAGWLIEQAGWKGKSFGNYGVHKNQALVLVNYGGAKGDEIKQLAFDIQEDVKQQFDIDISPEVNFV